MKKFLALLLSVLMLLSMTVVFADEGDGTGDGTTPPVGENGTIDEGGEDGDTESLPEDAVTSFKKSYTGATPVGDKLNFNVVFVKEVLTGSDVAPNPALITIPEHTVVAGENIVKFTYTKPAQYGSYIYKITEAAPTNPGYVTYDTKEMYIVINYTTDSFYASLTNDPNGGSTGTETKADEFVNKYAVGQFDVTKKITGNAAVDTDKFVVEVSFTSEKDLNDLAMTMLSSTAAEGTAPTAITEITSLTAGAATTKQITIGKDETITFANVPQGVKINVVEKKQDGDYTDLNKYTATYDKQEITVDGDGESITITNTKNVNIPTGVSLDTVPYIVLLAVAVLGVVAFVVKRRMAAADED